MGAKESGDGTYGNMLVFTEEQELTKQTESTAYTARVRTRGLGVRRSQGLWPVASSEIKNKMDPIIGHEEADVERSVSDVVD